MSAELDVHELMRLARDRSMSGRTELVTTVSDLYFNHSQDLSEREMALMTDILRQLVHDVEMSVRRSLAERLSNQADAPKALIIALANDEIEIAHPILVGSPVLQNEELIEVIQHRTKEHQLAIAMRRTVNEPVSDALVRQGHEEVLRALLENAGAQIAENTMHALVEQARVMQGLQKPLLSRNELSPDLAKRMYWWVSAALRQHITDTFPVIADELDGLLEDTVREVIAETRKYTEEAEAGRRALADQLARSDALTAKFLIQVLREGEIGLFETMFARLTQLEERLVKRILYEPGGKGLAVTCKGVGIQKPDFASLFLLSRQGRPGDKVVDPSELSGALSVYDFVDQDTSWRVLRRWRLQPDYVAAIREVESRMDTRVSSARN